MLGGRRQFESSRPSVQHSRDCSVGASIEPIGIQRRPRPVSFGTLGEPENCAAMRLCDAQRTVVSLTVNTLSQGSPTRRPLGDPSCPLQ